MSEASAIRMVQIVIEPFRLVAMAVLYTVVVSVLLAVGAAGGYGFSLYQIAQQHSPQASAEMNAQPAPAREAPQPQLSKPTLPDPDAFGLKQ